MTARQQHTYGATGRVYTHLFQQIVHTGELSPNTLLSESEVAKQLKISRTPVREALLMLEGEGLLKRYPGRGYLVTEITVQDVDEIIELRLSLEICALRKTYRVVGADLLDDLERRLLRLGEGDSPDDFYAVDRALHGLLVEYCGNFRLREYLKILKSQLERMRCISARRPDRLKESRAEHLDIVRAMQARDLPLAEEMLSRHIYNMGESAKTVCLRRKVSQTFLSAPFASRGNTQNREENQ